MRPTPFDHLRLLATRRWAAPVFAVVGLGLLSVVYVIPHLYYGESPSGEMMAVLGVLLLVGVALQIVAVAGSLIRARRRRSVPVVALLLGGGYALLGARAGLGAYREAEERRQWFREDTTRATYHVSKDYRTIEVRSAAVRWRVPVDVCPGARRGPRDGYGSTFEDGVFEIRYGDDSPYSLRLHVAEKRVTCPPPDSLRR